MTIDKKLLLFFLTIMTLSLSTMAQTRTRDLSSFENQEVRLRNVVEIFPNPTADYLHVEIKQSELVNVGFELYNIIGNSLSVSYEQTSSNTFKIPVKDFAPGYYMLIIKDDDTRYRKAFKFMKI